MNKKRWLCLVGAGICALVIAILLVPTLVPGAMVLGSVNDREVIGRASNRGGPARFQSDGINANLQLGTQTARVTADQVELAGGRTVSIPASCKKVELVETRTGIRILFDGSEHK